MPGDKDKPELLPNPALPKPILKTNKVVVILVFDD